MATVTPCPFLSALSYYSDAPRLYLRRLNADQYDVVSLKTGTLSQQAVIQTARAYFQEMQQQQRYCDGPHFKQIVLRLAQRKDLAPSLLERIWRCIQWGCEHPANDKNITWATLSEDVDEWLYSDPFKNALQDCRNQLTQSQEPWRFYQWCALLEHCLQKEEKRSIEPRVAAWWLAQVDESFNSWFYVEALLSVVRDETTSKRLIREYLYPQLQARREFYLPCAFKPSHERFLLRCQPHHADMWRIQVFVEKKWQTVQKKWMKDQWQASVLTLSHKCMEEVVLPKCLLACIASDSAFNDLTSFLQWIRDEQGQVTSSWHDQPLNGYRPLAILAQCMDAKRLLQVKKEWIGQLQYALQSSLEGVACGIQCPQEERGTLELLLRQIK